VRVEVWTGIGNLCSLGVAGLGVYDRRDGTLGARRMQRDPASTSWTSLRELTRRLAPDERVDVGKPFDPAIACARVGYR
jgi:hypothetical protein